MVKIYFRIKFRILILDLMLLPKNSVPFEGLYSSNTLSVIQIWTSDLSVCVQRDNDITMAVKVGLPKMDVPKMASILCTTTF